MTGTFFWGEEGGEIYRPRTKLRREIRMNFERRCRYSGEFYVQTNTSV